MSLKKLKTPAVFPRFPASASTRSTLLSTRNPNIQLHSGSGRDVALSGLQVTRFSYQRVSMCAVDCFFSFHSKKKQTRKPLNYPYQLLLEDHLLEPLEIQRLEGGEDEERVLLVAFGLLDGSFWIRDPQGGLGSHVFAVTKHRRFVQPWGNGDTRAWLAKTHGGDDGDLVENERRSSPHDDVVLVDLGAQGLVGQDPPVSHDDASFTAQAATLKLKKKTKNKRVTLMRTLKPGYLSAS